MIRFIAGLLRLSSSSLLAFLCGLVGAFLFHFLGDVSLEWIDEHAPKFYIGFAPRGLNCEETPNCEYSRKLVFGSLLIYCGLCGFVSTFASTFSMIYFRLGGWMSIIRAYAIILGGGLAGGLVGWLIGYWLGSGIPEFLRGLFPWGDKPWFDPLQVGIGLGIFVGILTGLFVGAVVCVVSTWVEVGLASNRAQSQVEV